MANRRWGPGSEVRFDVAQPIGQVIEYSPTGYSAPSLTPSPSATPTPRPGAGELLKIALAVSGCVLLGVWLTTWGSKTADFIEAFRLACVVSGAVLIAIWLALIALYLAADLGRSFDHLLIATLKAREIAADREVRLAEIHMRRAVSLAQARLDADRAQTARAALVASNATPAAVLQRTPVEEKLIAAVMACYALADPQTGYIRSDKPCPLGKRQLGTAYDEVIAWISDPARRVGGVVGAAAVATYDGERKAWRLDLDRYPTPDKALLTLTGNTTIAALGLPLGR